MDELTCEYQILNERLKTECSLQLDKGCLSTYEGDADESKIAGLAEVGLVRLYYAGSKPVDVYICQACLDHKIKDGWSSR